MTTAKLTIIEPNGKNGETIQIHTGSAWGARRVPKSFALKALQVLNKGGCLFFRGVKTVGYRTIIHKNGYYYTRVVD